MRVFKKALLKFGVISANKDWKEEEEMDYWRKKYSQENGSLSNDHYRKVFCEAFTLDYDDFADKRILDIGCGPRGSLEWADHARQRVGLDPLVPQYLEIGADRHAMEYSAAGSEQIPFPDGHFDIVTCLNALDHVDDFDRTVTEIERVTTPGGYFLLSTEIDHPPTPTEPITLTQSSFAAFSPEFEIVQEERFGTPADHNLHRAVIERSPPHVPGRPGIYVATMVRQ